MARSHIAVALATALVAILLITHLVADLGASSASPWQDRRSHRTPTKQTHILDSKQSSPQSDDASSYLIGVGKADITG